jgi:hypothetical protein
VGREENPQQRARRLSRIKPVAILFTYALKYCVKGIVW